MLRSLILILSLLFTAGSLFGFAKVPEPQPKIDAAIKAISDAKAANKNNHGDELLKTAEEKLESAKQLMEKGEKSDATITAAEAEGLAIAAKMKCEVGAKLDSVIAEKDALKKKVEEMEWVVKEAEKKTKDAEQKQSEAEKKLDEIKMTQKKIEEERKIIEKERTIVEESKEIKRDFDEKVASAVKSKIEAVKESEEKRLKAETSKVIEETRKTAEESKSNLIKAIEEVGKAKGELETAKKELESAKADLKKADAKVDVAKVDVEKAVTAMSTEFRNFAEKAISDVQAGIDRLKKKKVSDKVIKLKIEKAIASLEKAKQSLKAGDLSSAVTNSIFARNNIAVAEELILIYEGVHIVQSGECLWAIAGSPYALGNPFKWKQIYRANRSKIKNPDLIFPYQVLKIPK